MATGVSDVDISDEEFFATQDKALEQHIQKLHRKLDEYEGLVKSTMRSLGRNASPHYLTMAFLFLTQIFRNLSDVVAANGENSSEAAQATTSTTPASSSTAASSSRPPSSLSQRSSFMAQTDNDSTPRIQDVKLLPRGLAMFADEQNWCVKLFTIAGQYLHSVTTGGLPHSLAIVDVTATHSWEVAVTVSRDKIVMLKGTQHGIRGQRTITTSRVYDASDTIAVGHYVGIGIDLIEHTGKVIRTINPGLRPRHMVWSPDQTLVMTTTIGSSAGPIAKVTITDGSAVYKDKVEQVQTPYGITCTQDGSCIITDSMTRTLHLVTSDGVWVRQIWAHPAGDDDDELWSVCVFQNVCLCCTKKGSVFVLDIS